MNNITVIGNIGTEIELKYTTNQMAIAEFRVAATTGKDDKKKTTWFSIKAFGSLAENITKTAGKGVRVIVSGRMETDEYTKKDGTKSSWTNLIAEEIGVSTRWDAWVKDSTGDTMAKVGKIGRDIPTNRYDEPEQPF